MMFMYSDGGSFRAYRVFMFMHSHGGSFMAYRVFMFMYSDRGSFIAYRVYERSCIVMEGHLGHIGCLCSCMVIYGI